MKLKTGDTITKKAMLRLSIIPPALVIFTMHSICLGAEPNATKPIDNADAPAVEFVASHAAADGGTLSATINVADKKARLVAIDSREEQKLIRYLELAMAPHQTMAATEAREKAIRQGGADGIPLPPGGGGAYGVECGLSMLNRIHTIQRRRQLSELDEKTQ